MNPPRFAIKHRAVIGVMVGWLFFGLNPAIAQEYTITKLRLFPDRDEVLIKDVTRDSLGFIWFLTNGEIYRFDGYRSLDILKTISDQLPTDEMPQRILVDQRNRLWMAGNTGLSYLDLVTWKVYAIDAGLLPPIADRAVSWIMRMPDQTIVVAYENGHILLINGDKIQLIDKLNTIGVNTTGVNRNKIFARTATMWKGKFWIGTTAGSLLSIDPARGYEVSYDELPEIRNVIMSLIPQEDNLVVNVYQQGIFRYREGDTIRKITLDGLTISSDNFNLLKQGQNLHVYVDIENAYMLDSNLRVQQKLQIPSQHRFRTASVHISGNEVLLGNEEGIFVVYPKTRGLSELIPLNPGANKSTRGVYVFPDGAIFYGTYDGAGYINPAGKVSTFQELRHAYSMIPVGSDELLIGTEGGFLKIFNRITRQIKNVQYSLSEVAGRLYTFNLPNYVLSLAETDTDYLVGSLAGLWQLDKKNRQLSRVEAADENTKLSDLQVRHIRITGKNQFLLATNLGLFELNGSKLIKRFPQTGNLGVYRSEVVGDTLWLATQGKGLVGINSAGDELRVFSTANGLSNNLVYSLVYANGVLVAGTADGLNLIMDQRVRRIGMGEGLHQTEFNSGASFWDKARQKVYIGGLMGYTVLDMTQKWFGNHPQLESYVTEIHTSTRNAGERTSDYTWPYRSENKLVLEPGESLTGLYAGTPANYRTDAKIRYALNQGDWEPLELGQFISLIEPSPGDYELLLETRSTGIQRRQKEYHISKKPYYYETWWFGMLIGMLAIGIVVLWYRSRIRKIAREQSIRNRIAADLHDEVGSSLTRIFYQANTLAAGSGEKANLQLRQISDTSKHALLTMSDMVWSIDSRFDTTRDLVIRMKDYVYRLREELDFSYKFEEPGESESGSLSQVVRQNLFLIYKEAITNAIKYGNGAEIEISLHLSPAIHMAVVNHYGDRNGDISGRQGGRGMENMKLRAAKVGATLSIVDAGGKFSVIFNLPPKKGI